MMSKGTAIIGMIVGMIVGVFLGQSWNTGHGDSGGVVPAAASPDSSVERFKVPLGDSPVRGPEHAKVTIVEWSDFQCPFCSRVEPTIDQIMKTYGRDVRLVWRNQPLSFHQNAKPAAEIAMAAYVKKGNAAFWRVHDEMFRSPQALERASLEKYAKNVGLDDGDIKDALDSHKYDRQIDADSQAGTAVGARGTPAFFINGRFLSGAQPFDVFKKVIDEELATATRAMKSGATLANVYETLTASGKQAAAAAEPRPQAAQPAQADPNSVYAVPLGNSPDKGPKAAKVTVVEFSDFQCPFCGRVEPTLRELEADYGKDLRVVWKNNPLPFHPNAMPAAKAAMAAAAQGKFWEMHDKIFADQSHLDPAEFEKYAQDIGLDVSKFKAAMSDPKSEAAIKAEQQLASRFGANSTPAFFINGRPMRGAQPKESFKTIIDKEIATANAALKRGVKPADLYAELTKGGKDKAEGAAPTQAQQQRPGQPDDNTIYRVIVGDAPAKGADARRAKVTVVEFSDFQCPFCSRVEATLDQLLKEYGNDLRIVYKELPMPFHGNAHAAAEAALAAKAQGKFWQMHDVMFKNQQALDRASLERYASQIGLNVEKFKSDLDSGKWKQKVDEELKEGNRIGANGTPWFFINGKSFVGAQPYEAFKAKVDDAIKDAGAHAHGGNYGKYYDDLMKTAKTEVAAAPTAAAAAGDNRVYQVDAGNAPAKGPRTAPVQIVEFSDFQCPYCGRVVPTIKQITDKYGEKVRVSFRNFPLPFHSNAHIAAEAGAAAAAQGKFWEMHDKMFANQQTLDRASLEKYAAELGLDVGKFKSDLDSGKYKDAVNKDVEYARTINVNGTPAFFVNGHFINGAMPYESFASLIDEELKKKK
jgi:protein-disulfide isomerase